MDKKFFSDLKSDLKSDFNKLGFGSSSSNPSQQQQQQQQQQAKPAASSNPASPRPAGAATPTSRPSPAGTPTSTTAPNAAKSAAQVQPQTPQKAQPQQQARQPQTASDASSQSGRVQRPEAAEKEGGSTFGGLNILSPFSKKDAAEQDKEKSSSSNLFSVELLGGKGTKGKDIAQYEQEASRMRKELIERDQRIEALAENLKHMVASQENLERQLELYKMKARDAPLISTGNESDHIHDLELKLVEQQEKLLQAQEANRKLKRDLQNKSQGGQGSFSPDTIAELQQQIDQLFEQAQFRMLQQDSNNDMLMQPAAEPLLSFSQPAQAPADPFDLLGLNETPIAQPPQVANNAPPSAVNKVESLKQLKSEVSATISQLLSAAQPEMPQGNQLERLESTEAGQSAYSHEFVENLKAQIELWKDTAQKKAEALAQAELSLSEKIAGVQKMFDEELIFKDAEIANLRKLTVTKLDERKTDYEYQYKSAAEQLNKMSLNLQDVSTELTKTLQDNQKLQANVASLEEKIQALENTRTGMAEQSQGSQRKLAATEEELKQKTEQLNTLKASLETTRSTLNAMSAKSNALREEKKEVNDRYIEAMDKLANLEKLASSRKQDADSFSREKDVILNNYHEQARKLEELTKKNKADIERLQAEKEEAVTAAQHEVAEMEAKAASLSNELQACKDLVTELRAQIATLEATVVGRDEQIEELKAAHAAEIEQMNGSIAQVQEQLAQLQGEREADQVKIEELQNTLDGFETERRNAEKKSAQLIKDLKKQLAQERKGIAGGSSGGIAGKDSEQDSKRHSEDKESSSDVSQMKDDLDNLITKVTSLQSEIMDLKRKNKVLNENVEVLRADNEAKSKIVQDYLLKEKVGIIHPSSSPSSSAPPSPHKESGEHRSKLANLANLPSNLAHLPSNLSSLSPLTSKKKSSAQLENAMGHNKKLQDVVEETMMKNLQLQELIKNMGEEIEILKGQLKEKEGSS